MTVTSLFRLVAIPTPPVDLTVVIPAFNEEQRLGHSVVEVPVTWHDDRRSRVRPWHDLWKVIREAAAIKRNLDRGAYGLPVPTR